MALCRNVAKFLLRSTGKSTNNFIPVLTVQPQYEDGRRHLFSSEILGLENYQRQKDVLAQKTGINRDKFFKRIDDYMKASDNNTIFTDDMKSMVYMAETDSELESGVKMIKRFHMQNNNLRFSNFVFGPLVLRLCHSLNKPDVAFELFTDENLKGFFDQMSSFVILMDLLYKSEQYEHVLEVMEVVKDRQVNSYKYPVDCITLATAALYKINTEDALTRMMALLKDASSINAIISMRSAVYAAMLALKQRKAAVAYELLSVSELRPNSSLPVAYINAKLLILTSLGQIEDAVDQLKAIVQQDIPAHTQRGGEVFGEVLEKVRASVQKDGSKELQHRLEVAEKALKSGNHLASETRLDEYLQRTVVRKNRNQDGFKQRDRAPVSGGFQRVERGQYRKPGLLDMQ